MSKRRSQSKVNLQGNGGDAGSKTITAAGTAEQITSTKTIIQCVTIAPLPTNTGHVGVGFSSTDSLSTSGVYKIPTSNSGAIPIKINIDDLSKIWIDAAVNGEGISWLAEKDSNIVNDDTRRTTY